jgi:hypothetical protein
VLATTNPKLTFLKEGDEYNGYNLIPQIPQSFIEDYVKNPVDKVELEYEKCGRLAIRHYEPQDYKLKLVNNEVMVVESKPKLYTKEEVEKLCEKAYSDGENEGYINYPMLKGGGQFKWLKENL